MLFCCVSVDTSCVVRQYGTLPTAFEPQFAQPNRADKTNVPFFVPTIVLILLFLLLQCSFFVHLSLADVVPNLLIILTASIAIINGSLEGCLVGFCCGLLLDLMFGPYIGMYAFGYMLCGYLTGIGNRLFYKEDLTFPVLMIAAADLFYGFYMYVFGLLFDATI